ncbi:MAG: hypothetical protein L6R40_002229 [Gallowayella cf. fulva]|nr:MAG: hypothetical protein L6R40_002229 [Xanthomendoza cf. fulva]
MPSHTSLTPLLHAAEDFPIISPSNSPGAETRLELSRPSTPNRKYHDLPTEPLSPIERFGTVTSRPFNPPVIPLQASLRHEADTHNLPMQTDTAASGSHRSTFQATAIVPAAVALPPSEPSTPVSAPIASSKPRPTLSIAITPTRYQFRNGRDYRSTSSSSNDKSSSPGSANSDPTNDQATDNDGSIPTVEIAELVGDELMSTLEAIPADWTLTDFVNHIIENDIELPTEEEIDGDRAANAAALPFDDRPPFDEHESAMVEFARANPGFEFPDGLRTIGESVYCKDPVTGLLKKRPGRFDPTAAAVTVEVEQTSSAAEAEKTDRAKTAVEVEGVVEVKMRGEDRGVGGLEKGLQVGEIGR